MISYRKTVENENQLYRDFETAHRDTKRKHTSKASVYGTPFYQQIWALMKRQFPLKWQDRFSLVVSWITSLIVAIILGTVWINLLRTSAGAFTRSGVI